MQFQLRSKTPMTLRQMGAIRKVTNPYEFEPTWLKLTGANILREVIWKWLEANPAAKDLLMETKTNVLVYASEYDKGLGNGLEFASTLTTKCLING